MRESGWTDGYIVARTPSEGAVSARHAFVFLWGHWNDLAVFKGNIAWQVELWFGVHETDYFHAFDYFEVGGWDEFAYRFGRRIAAKNYHGFVPLRMLLQLFASA